MLFILTVYGDLKILVMTFLLSTLNLIFAQNDPPPVPPICLDHSSSTGGH